MLRSLSLKICAGTGSEGTDCKVPEPMLVMVAPLATITESGGEGKIGGSNAAESDSRIMVSVQPESPSAINLLTKCTVGGVLRGVVVKLQHFNAPTYQAGFLDVNLAFSALMVLHSSSEWNEPGPWRGQ